VRDPIQGEKMPLQPERVRGNPAPEVTFRKADVRRSPQTGHPKSGVEAARAGGSSPREAPNDPWLAPRGRLLAEQLSDMAFGAATMPAEGSNGDPRRDAL
jgi:hypothetical protein